MSPLSRASIASPVCFIESFAGGAQPNIHPGSIPSTGRTAQLQYNAATGTVVQNGGVIPGLSSPLGTSVNIFGGLNGAQTAGGLSQIIMGATPTSTQNLAQQQLIGGAISPSLITVQPGAGGGATTTQVSHLEHSTNAQSSSASAANSSTGEPPLKAAAIIDAPMLSAMQQMFMEQPAAAGKTVTLVYHPTQTAPAAPIYFN